MKFQKRPIVVEAEQFWPSDKQWPKGVEPQPCHCAELAQDGRLCELHKTNGRRYGVIRTLEGVMEVSPGDWVITGIHGEKYPCKPDIFEETYEAAAMLTSPFVPTSAPEYTQGYNASVTGVAGYWNNPYKNLAQAALWWFGYTHHRQEMIRIDVKKELSILKTIREALK